MKKFFLFAIAVVAVVAILVSSCGQQFKEANAGREVCIGWEEVNLRESYSTSKKVITTLVKGEPVTLTGNSFEYAGDGEAIDSWTEVQLDDGTIGWVVTESIDW